MCGTPAAASPADHTGRARHPQLHPRPAGERETLRRILPQPLPGKGKWAGRAKPDWRAGRNARHGERSYGNVAGREFLIAATDMVPEVPLDEYVKSFRYVPPADPEEITMRGEADVLRTDAAGRG